MMPAEFLKQVKDMDPELVVLADRYCEERLTTSEIKRLEELLKDDRRSLAFVQLIEIHAGLHWHLRGAVEASSVVGAWEANDTKLIEYSSLSSDDTASVPSIGRVVRWPAIAAFATAACLFAAFAWWLSQPKGIVKVASVIGEVAWHSDKLKGRIVRVGEALSEGHFVSADDESLLSLLFADGTQLEFSGPLKVFISGASQKTIFVEKGVLTAQVASQPVGRPLLVRSPTAEIEVLGTVFTFDSEQDASHLQVAEGKVRLRRVADGDNTIVVAKQSVLVTAQTKESLEPTILPAPPQNWNLAFDPALEAIRGKILPADANGTPRRVAAITEVSVHADGKSFESFPRVVVQSPLRVGAGFVTLRPDTHVELRWRRPLAKRIGITLYLRRPDGSNGGHMNGKVEADVEAIDDHGWQVSSVSLSDLTWTQPANAPKLASLDDLRVSAFVVTELQRGQTGLEVASIQFVRVPSDKPKAD